MQVKISFWRLVSVFFCYSAHIGYILCFAVIYNRCSSTIFCIFFFLRLYLVFVGYIVFVDYTVSLLVTFCVCWFVMCFFFGNMLYFVVLFCVCRYILCLSVNLCLSIILSALTSIPLLICFLSLRIFTSYQTNGSSSPRPHLMVRPWYMQTMWNWMYKLCVTGCHWFGVGGWGWWCCNVVDFFL